VKRMLLCSAILLVIAAMAPNAFADQKVKKRMTANGQSFDTTSYIKGQRSRDEMNFGQMQMITIRQCDLHQTITVMDRTKSYMIAKDPTSTSQPAKPATGAKTAPKEEVIEEEEAPVAGARKGGVVTINTSVQDTGETKDFFGYKARHIKTTMSMESSADACDPNQKTTMTTDGWYIDFHEKVQLCERPVTSASGPSSPMRQSQPTCQDKMRFTGSGLMASRNLGYPVDTTMTVTGKDGKTNTIRTQALEISSATLDPSLFDAPAGYRQASGYGDMMGMNMRGMLGAAMSGRASGAAPSRAEAPTPEAKGVKVGRKRVGTYEIGPKQAGKLRIGVVAFADPSGKVTDADVMRRTLMQNIEKYGYEAVPIDSRTQDAAMADAKTFECDYVTFNDLAAQTTPAQSAKKIGGLLGRAMSGGLAGAAVGGSNQAGGPFQGTVNYRLFKVATPDPTDPEMTKSAEAKGSSGGNDAMGRESKDIATQIVKDRS
jgi:hypothetical protein